MDTRIERGRSAEWHVCRQLQEQGYRLRGRNLRDPRAHGGGEIDLLFERNGVLWIVEVKSVARSRLGETPLLSEAQRARLKRSIVWIAGRERCFVRLLLAWWDPERESLEILENP